MKTKYIIPALSILATLVILISTQANATSHSIYYVDINNENCSDSYTKAQATNENTPFCSINSAFSQISAGDELIIKYGVYEQGLYVRWIPSGTPENPIII